MCSGLTLGTESVYQFFLVTNYRFFLCFMSKSLCITFINCFDSFFIEKFIKLITKSIANKSSSSYSAAVLKKSFPIRPIALNPISLLILVFVTNNYRKFTTVLQQVMYLNINIL